MRHQPAGVTVAVCDDVREGVREAVVYLTRAENRGERIHMPRISKRMSKRISEGLWSGYGAPHWWRISLLPISHWSTQKRKSF